MAQTIDMAEVRENKIGDNHSSFVIEPLLPGFGSTLGNSLRRVLLSSIPGAAISYVKLNGVAHEFSAIPHVKEDMIEIILNLKKIDFISHSDEPVTVELSAKGPKVVTAADFAPNSNVEILNKDAFIATLDKGAVFDLEVTIETGYGFIATEERPTDKTDIGKIAVDSVFTPIKLVNYKVENTRVGQMTNLDKVELEIVTNGAISPKDALTIASNILVENFRMIAEGKERAEVAESEIDSTVESDSAETLDNFDPKTKVEDLKLSSRTVNALLNSGIKTVAGLKRLSDLKLSEIKGLGKKGYEEIKELLGK